MVKTKRALALLLSVLALSATVFFIGDDAAACHVSAVSSGEMLIAGGMTFGMKISITGAVVVGTNDVNGAKSPAESAGLRRGDIIIRANDKAISSTNELLSIIDGGGEINIVFTRGGKERSASLHPLADENGKQRIGVMIRDSAAGIGTITYIDPESMAFAGLGHGVCDSASGTLLPMLYGSVENVNITGISIGRVGAPGEIRGAFTGRRIGKIIKNSETGVYGMLSELPSGADKTYYTASADEICDGRAYVRSMIGGTPELYEIEIKKIGYGREKNLSVRIIDERLKNITGGIVQGMSGSPIIQNDKLIGAITHVLVGEPTEGYGIFIENTLDAAG